MERPWNLIKDPLEWTECNPFNQSPLPQWLPERDACIMAETMPQCKNHTYTLSSQSHLLHQVHTSLATKQSRLNLLKNLSSYVILLIVGNYMTVVCFFSLHFPGGEIWEANLEKSSYGCQGQGGGQQSCSGTYNSKRTPWEVAVSISLVCRRICVIHSLHNYSLVDLVKVNSGLSEISLSNKFLQAPEVGLGRSNH